MLITPTDPNALTLAAMQGALARLSGTVLPGNLKQISTLIYKNPWGLTPQQAFTVIGGTTAGGISAEQFVLAGVLMAGALQAAGITPPAIQPTNQNVTVNDDGTVTVVSGTITPITVSVTLNADGTLSVA